MKNASLQVFGQLVLACSLAASPAPLAFAQASDADDDGVPDSAEAPGDTDGDGTPDVDDADDDGDGVDTRLELLSIEMPQDLDEDGTPDYLDADDDGDGIPTRDEGTRETSGRPDYLSSDDDGDGLPTRAERPNDMDRDTDGDGDPDHRDTDDDGDSMETELEAPAGVERDTDSDGLKDQVDADDDGDGIPTNEECGGGDDSDVDADGTLNCYDDDSDGDGKTDAFERGMDTDEDGVPDYLDVTATPKDSDKDGVADVRECEMPALGCPDIDGDGIKDYLDPDDDGDGVSTLDEQGQSSRDTDGDDTPDYLDDDDDGDGVLTRNELDAQGRPRDTDGDGTPDYLDIDDDQDGLLTRAEGGLSVDADADGIPDFLDFMSTGPVDAGVLAEGGVSEAGMQSDAELAVQPPARSDGCSVAGTRSSSAALSCLGLLALASLIRRRRSAAAAALMLLACDDGEGEGPHAGFDATVPDAAAPMDARVDARAEAGMDAQQSSCMAGELSFLVGDTSARSFSAAIDENRVHLAMIAPSCGGATYYGQGKGLRYITFSSSGEPGYLRDVDRSGECLPALEPTLLLHGARAQPSLFFGSSREAKYELYSLDPESSEPGQRARTESDAIEVALAAAALGADRAPFVAYVPESTIPSTEASSIRLAGAVTTVELLPQSADHHPRELALARRAGAEGTGVVGWVNDRPSTRGVYLRLLGNDGTPSGDVITLSRDLGTRSQVAFAAREAVTGVLYTVDEGSGVHELRYRALDAGGTLSEPVRLTSDNQDVLQFGIAPYRNGFATVFRTREDDGSYSIRALGFSDSGNRSNNALLAQSTGDGTAVQVHQAQDGRLIILFDEPAPPPGDGGLSDFNRVLWVGRTSCF